VEKLPVGYLLPTIRRSTAASRVVMDAVKRPSVVPGNDRPTLRWILIDGSSASETPRERFRGIYSRCRRHRDVGRGRAGVAFSDHVGVDGAHTVSDRCQSCRRPDQRAYVRLTTWYVLVHMSARHQPLRPPQTIFSLLLWSPFLRTSPADATATPSSLAPV